MAENSKIEWTDHTFNPWIGCTKVHEGCAHCYAEADMDKRRGRVKWGPGGTRSKTSADYWKQPLKWNREAEQAGVRARVFCASLADVFEDWGGPINLGNMREAVLIRSTGGYCVGICDDREKWVTLDDLRRDLFALIAATPWLDWLLLTKRPENILEMWPFIGCPDAGVPGTLGRRLRYDNVWIGTSISLQAHAETQIPELLKCRDLAPVLFLSIEPLLGPINLTMIRDPNRFPGCAYFDVLSGRMIHEDDGNKWTPEPHIDWVIVGGESGPGARPLHPQLARDIRNQCQAAGVPFHFKQWGQWSPITTTTGRQEVPFMDFDTTGERGHFGFSNVGKARAGRMLDGREWSEFPEVTHV